MPKMTEPKRESSIAAYAGVVAQTGDTGLCERALAHLFEYIDSEMSPEHLARMRAHLESCPDCEYEAEVAEHIKALVHRSCCVETAPESLRMRIVRQIEFFHVDNS